jgi:uncharacterized protein
MPKNSPITLDPEGFITGYASLFNSLDEAGDMVEKGAFNACIAKKGIADVRMLWQHDPAQPIGKWLHIYEDEVGLKVTGQICLDIQKGRDVRALLLAGALDGLSIGFKAIKSRKARNQPHRILTEIDLWEISLVTFPALKGARVSSVKGGDLNHLLKKTSKKNKTSPA